MRCEEPLTAPPCFGRITDVALKVLIVDDNADVRQGLEDLLAPEGYDLTTAATSFGAKQALEEDVPAIALLDRRMPGMDGLMLCRHARRAAREYCYVIIVTGFSDVTSTLEAFAAGADDVVSKPWVAEELLARVRVGARVVSAARPGQTLQGALAEAFEAGGGEVVARIRDRAARIHVQDGKIAWVHLPQDGQSLYALLRDRVGLAAESWKAVVEECRATKANLAETIVKGGFAAQEDVAACVRDLIASRVETITAWGGPAMFLPGARQFSGAGFALEDLPSSPFPSSPLPEQPARSPRPPPRTISVATEGRLVVSRFLQGEGVLSVGVIDTDSGDVAGAARDGTPLRRDVVQSLGRSLRGLAPDDATEELSCRTTDAWHWIHRVEPGDARCLYLSLSLTTAAPSLVSLRAHQIVGRWRAERLREV